MIEGYENVLIDYYVEAVDGNGVFSNSDIQHVWVGNGTLGGGGERVVVSPDPPTAGGTVTIDYDAAGGPLSGVGQVYLHYGINDWAAVYDDVAMTFDSDLQVWTASVPLAVSANQLDLVFNDGAVTWDNNNGQDWHFSVAGAEQGFEMDGQLDAVAELVAANNGQRLFFAVSQSNQLYLATDDAGEGADAFIYVARNPGNLIPANWEKSGVVAQWDGFLADENDNDFHSWFDISGTSATGPNGGMLEGVLDLQAVYGTVPETIWVAVGTFETQNGGSLLPQFQLPPSLDGDGNIEIAEWIELELVTTSTLLGDANNDGVFSNLDISSFVLALTDPVAYRASFPNVDPDVVLDMNHDGVLDNLDISAFVAALVGP